MEARNISEEESAGRGLKITVILRRLKEYCTTEKHRTVTGGVGRSWVLERRSLLEFTRGAVVFSMRSKWRCPGGSWRWGLGRRGQIINFEVICARAMFEALGV